MIRSNRVLAALVVAGLAFGLTGMTFAAGLDGPASIVFDQYRVPTIIAQTEHDAIYLQGYMHAKDRFFQMDYQRHLFSGTLSELVGSPALPTDVQLRTLGLRRAAVRSLPVQTPETTAWLEAYADGVNAWLQNTAEPFPIEYGSLEITRAGIAPWTPTDSLVMVKGLAFGLSFDLGDIDRTLAILNFRGVCDVIGCNGLNLFNNDLWRTAPFEAVASIPPSPPPPAPPGEESGSEPADQEMASYITAPRLQSALERYRSTVMEIPILREALEFDLTAKGSNWWVVSSARSESGVPLIANDPHLSLGTAATFYEAHLVVTGGMNVTGVNFPGAPGVVLGCNETICWGATVNALDVTDVYQEVLGAQIPGQPTTPTNTIYNGSPEPLTFITQVFNVNIIGDTVPNNLVDAGVPADQGGVTLIVPRRNEGPIVQVDFDPTPGNPTPLTGFSVAYTGWSATQELETFRRFARASSMTEFKDALQYFDVGSQNWAYADVNGNIAYYTSAELPIRQDLQFGGAPAGLIPPYLIRDGTNTNPHDWLQVLNPQPQQALNREILPFAEMPQIENPAAGYIINANNDPIGTSFDNNSWAQPRVGGGALYLSPGYAPGFRAGRIQRLFDGLLAGGGKVSEAESIAVQANNQLLDAEVLRPYLINAYANATAPGAAPELAAIVADPRIGDAVSRIQNWDLSSLTGIPQGWDPFDPPGVPSGPEVDASVATTIYSLWRGQLVQRVVDVTLATLPVPLDTFAPGSAQAMSGLRRFLDNYAINGGTGSSLINFFNVPGVPDQNVARDIVLLGTLQAGLDLAASDEFAPAFGNSTDLNDYRWGYLHRIVFRHPLGGPVDIPPPGNPLNVSPSLAGIARSGGMGSVDAASHSVRADGLDEFMFGSGPSRRLIASMNADCPQVQEVIPGGESGAPGSPQQTDQLFLWLVNANKPLAICDDQVQATAVETVPVDCGDGIVGTTEQCDDGNTVDGDGCTAACVAEVCGDGTVNNTTEECDDGNTVDGDGCSATCVTEFCGDGTVNNTDEECDDGGTISGDGCSATCVTEFCGDGTVNNSDEECDDGGTVSGDGCTDTCVVEFCGDGVVNNNTETCDDGNTTPGDGCDEQCRAEVSGIPTVSEWGLIILMLLLLTAGSLVFGSRPVLAHAAAHGRRGTSPTLPTAPPFESGLFAVVLAATLGLVAVGFTAAFWLFGTLSPVDVTGALLSAPILAYLVHLFLLRRTDR